jgi:hypothetical protein
MELVNNAFKIFKKMQKLDDSNFEAQVECQSSIFKLMLGMSDEEIKSYNNKCDEFLKESKKR